MIGEKKPLPRVVLLGVWVSACQGGMVSAQSASRDLSNFGGPGSTFTVPITLDVPSSTTVVGVEDSPPNGWQVSAISDGGSFDVPSGKVKWGPFIDPSIPTRVTYDVAVPDPITGGSCFSGAASFDGQNELIGGDACLVDAIPATSTWGLLVMCLLVATAGSIVCGSGRDAPCG